MKSSERFCFLFCEQPFQSGYTAIHTKLCGVQNNIVIPQLFPFGCRVGKIVPGSFIVITLAGAFDIDGVDAVILCDPLFLFRIVGATDEDLQDLAILQRLRGTVSDKDRRTGCRKLLTKICPSLESISALPACAMPIIKVVYKKLPDTVSSYFWIYSTGMFNVLDTASSISCP